MLNGIIYCEFQKNSYSTFLCSTGPVLIFDRLSLTVQQDHNLISITIYFQFRKYYKYILYLQMNSKFFCIINGIELYPETLDPSNK